MFEVVLMISCSIKQFAHLDSHDRGCKNTIDSTKREEVQQGPLQDPIMKAEVHMYIEPNYCGSG